MTVRAEWILALLVIAGFLFSGSAQEAVIDRATLDAFLSQARELDDEALAEVDGMFLRAASRDPESHGEIVDFLTELLERAAEDKWIRETLVAALHKDLQWLRSSVIHGYLVGRNDAVASAERVDRLVQALLALPSTQAEALIFLVAKHERNDRPVPRDFWDYCLGWLSDSEWEIPGLIREGEISVDYLRSFPELAAFLAREHGAESEFRALVDSWKADPNRAGEVGLYGFFGGLFFQDQEGLVATLTHLPAGVSLAERQTLLRAGVRIGRQRFPEANLNGAFESFFEEEALRVRDVGVVLPYLFQVTEQHRLEEAKDLMASLFRILLEAGKRAKEDDKTAPLLAEVQAEQARNLAFDFLRRVAYRDTPLSMEAWRLLDLAPEKPPGFAMPTPLFLLGDSVYRDPVSFLTWLEHFGITSPAAEFELKPVPDTMRRQIVAHHWLTLFISKIRNHREVVPELEKLVADQYPDSIGVTILLAFARHGVDGQSWRKPLEDRLDLLEALPEKEKPAVASYLNGRTYTFRDCPNLGNWIWKHWNAELKTNVDALLAKAPEDANDETFDRYLAEVVKHRRFDYGLEILKRWVERQGPLATPSARARLVSARLARLNGTRSYRTPDRFWRWWLDGPESLEFQFVAFHDPELAPFEFDFPLYPHISRLDPETRHWKTRPVRERIPLLQFVGRVMEDHPSRMLLIPSAYTNLITKTPVGERALPVELAKKAEGPGAWLLHEVAVLGKDADQPHRSPPEGMALKLPEYSGDPDLPLEVRLNLINWEFDDASFPWLMEREVMLEFLDTWEEVLFPDGPDAAIPIEMVDVAHRTAVALRGLGLRDDWELDRDRLAAMTERLTIAVRKAVEREKDEITARVGNPEGGGSVVVSTFWPAFFHLMLADGNLEEALDLWQWTRENGIEFRWSRRYPRDGLTDEAGFLKQASLVAFARGGPELVESLLKRADSIFNTIPDPQRPGLVIRGAKKPNRIDPVVRNVIFALEPADRIRLVAAWLPDPPLEIDMSEKWDLIRPLSTNMASYTGRIRIKRQSREETFQELVRDLNANPIDARTAPLILSRIFGELKRTSAVPADAVVAWLESEFEAGEIESSSVLREVKWAFGGKNLHPEDRHLEALSSDVLPGRFRFLAGRQFWTALNLHDQNFWTDPADETFGRLTRALCAAAVEEIESGRSFGDLIPMAAKMFEALSIQAKTNPEAVAIAARVLKIAPNFLKNVNSSGTGSDLWIGTLLGVVTAESDRETVLPILEAAAANPKLVTHALDRYLLAGLFEEAGQLFDRSWEQIDMRRPRTTRFDPAFLAMTKTIGDEELRFLAELHVSWMIDPPIMGLATEPWGTARKRRIETLADRFRQLEFTNEAARKKAFDTLTSVSAGREMLEREIRQAMGGDLESVIAADSEETFSKQWEAWKLHLKSMAEAGRLAEFEAAIPDREWFGSEPVGRHGKATRQQRVWLSVFENFEMAIRSVPKDEWQRVERIFVTLETIPKTPERRFGPSLYEKDGAVTGHSIRGYAGTRLAFDVIRGMEKPGAGWFDSLPEAVNDPGRGRYQRHHIALSYLRAAHAFSPAREGTLEERREAAEVFLKSPLPISLFEPEHKRFFLLKFSGWLNRDELLAFGIEVAEADPRGGHAFADLGSELQTQDPERALSLLKRGLEMLDPDDKTWPVRGYHLTLKRLEDRMALEKKSGGANSDAGR